MRIPEKWLRHYCNPPVDGAALEHLLTMGGMEVESREPVAAAFSGVVVARIVSAAKHPDADRLQVCMVDVARKAAACCARAVSWAWATITAASWSCRPT